MRGAPALAILAVGHLTGALAVPAYVLLLSGKARYSTLAGASCLVFQLVALPILVPRYGLIGAALSSACAAIGPSAQSAAAAMSIPLSMCMRRSF